MKAILQRNQNPSRRQDGSVKCDESLLTTDANGRVYLATGTVIDHPQAYQLVMSGTALPGDDECLEALAKNGWGPDKFDANWAAQSAWVDGAERGLIAGMLQPHEEAATDDTGNPDE